MKLLLIFLCSIVTLTLVVIISAAVALSRTEEMLD